MNLTMKAIGNVKEKLNDYLAPYMEKMDKPRRKVLPELIEGVLASGSSFVAESARKIDPERLETTERRFLRTLRSPHWDETDLWVAHLKETAKQMKPKSMVTLDITDLAKPSARKLEALATVRDGSKKELTKGYWMLAMTTELGKERILPIVHEVFSQESDEFKSQNDILFFWMKGVLHFKKDVLFVMDRGGDGDPMFNFCLNEKADFLIRLRGDRVLLSEGKPVAFFNVPAKLPFGLRKILARRHSNITFDWQGGLTLPHRTEKLTLITVKGYEDRKPILLLTNQTIRSSAEAALLIDRYFKRWEIEESFRFLKQKFGFEKFLIRDFRAIQRFFFLLCIGWGFLSQFLQFKKVRQMVETLSFSFPKKISFFYYRWLKGTQFLFSLLHTFRFLEVI